MGHPERVMPFCVREVTVVAPGPGGERVVAQVTGNHQSRRIIRLPQPMVTDSLEFRVAAPGPNVPAALLEVRCYAAG